MTERSRVVSVDEQHDVPIDVARWARLMQLVLELEQVPSYSDASLLFVGEAEMSELNERFLEQAGSTDVLAFPIDGERIARRSPSDTRRDRTGVPGPDEPPLALGDVVVCPAVAARQSSARGAEVESELALLVVHGTLHLLGYDHGREVDSVRMRTREQEIMAEFEQVERVGEGV